MTHNAKKSYAIFGFYIFIFGENCYTGLTNDLGCSASYSMSAPDLSVLFIYLVGILYLQMPQVTIHKIFNV